VSIDALEQLNELDQADVVRCARVLLRRPLLRVGGYDDDLLPLVYRHRSTLSELFVEVLGYRLVVERRFARLYKPGPGFDPTRGDANLTPLSYTYVALCLAALTGMGQQTLLSRLVAEIRAAAVEADIRVSEERHDLRALTAALRSLVTLGVISETEGSISGLLGDSSAEALITIDTTLLGHIVAGPLHEAESANELVDLAARPGSRDLEFTVRRKLVENPITHYTDLPDEQAAWLRQRARSESRLLERCFGLVTESRLEGVAVTDPDGRLTDVDFPGQSSLARIALLSLPELLATAPADDCGWVTVTWDRIHLVCEEIVHSYPKAWAKDTVEDISKLVDRLLWHLRALGLVRAGDGETWLLSPAAHRWVPRPDDTPRTSAEPTQEPEDTWSLFDAYELEAQ